jgi:23S rRNA pseudouridine1911/1915/1917 synthase
MTRTLNFRIADENAGERIDEFLASRLGELSRMRIARLINEGACRVNDLVAQAGLRTQAGDRIEIAIEDHGPTSMTPSRVALDMLYEDEHLVVVVKPAGMLVHPTVGVKTGTLANALAWHFNRDFYDTPEAAGPGDALCDYGHKLIRPGLVHRLDRATSGLMVVAKTGRALRNLSRHFHKRLVEKRYLAITRGLIEEDSGVIVAPIGRDPLARPRWRVLDNGKKAETRFTVKERIGALTLVELEPVTGRTNQLRIHCAEMGHAILGDDLYDHAAGGDRLPGCARLCLHASRLAFHHPSTGEWIEFESALPGEMAEWMRKQ